VHGVGASRKGKSKLIEHIARDLIKEGSGFCLIDPHGELYENLIQWLAYLKPRREIELFNPSYEQRVVGFNPFKLDGQKDEARIATKVDRMVAATLRAWGASDFNQAPRLERWLRCLYHVLIEQDYSVEVARYFLSWEHVDIRNAIIQQIRSPAIREQWMSLVAAKTPQGYAAQLESTSNRLFKFITHPTIRRIIGLFTNNIDLEAITAKKKILLVNLQPSDLLSDDAARLIGTLLLNELWEILRRRKTGYGMKPPPFYLIIDEFQNYATPDVPNMLDEGAKYGLHLMLFHQRLSQLSPDLHGSVKNAHARFVFGGLPGQEVAQMLEGAWPSATAEQYKDYDDVRAAMMHPTRHFTLRRPDQRLITVTAPKVEDYHVRFDRLEQYVAEKTADYLTPEEVDAILAEHPFGEQGSAPAEALKSSIQEINDEDLFE
jgi:type IV secretory pathway TraG/TraD family ATPase VirD4